MRIPVAGQVGRAELRKGIALHFWPSPPLLVLAGIFLGFLLLLAAISEDPPRAFAAIARIVLGLGVILALFPLIFAEIQWRGDKGFRSRVEGAVTDEMLHLTHVHGELTLPWADVYRHKATRRLVLLYRTPLAPLPIPRCLFASEEDWTRFKQHVRATVPGPTRGWLRGALLFALFYAFVFFTLFNLR